MNRLGLILSGLVLLIGWSTVEAKTLYVKLLVDEEEPAVARLWQQRLGSRLAAASDIIGQYCDVRFAVKSFGTWSSDNQINDLSRSLAEFEQEVTLEPAELAIGFSSQYPFTPGKHQLGGTRGPLHPYILIRENNPRITEPERVEVLVHELGHYLGAVHSAQADSAMRPVVGDGLARSRSFRIRFDDDNARVLRLVGREINNLNVRRLAELSSQTRQELLSVYVKSHRELPDDPAAARYFRLIETAPLQDPQEP